MLGGDSCAPSGRGHVARVSISHERLVLFFQSLGSMLTRTVAGPSVGAGGVMGQFDAVRLVLSRFKLRERGDTNSVIPSGIIAAF